MTAVSYQDLAGCFPGGESVSRGTLDRLQALLDLVRKWTTTVNLVARSTLDDGWVRHVRDSAQIFALAPPQPRLWVDLGSGGGFPGLVVAILLAERTPACQVRLVESDKRKAAFLREAGRLCEAHVTVLCERAETLPAQAADVVSARALAPLPDLCALAARHLHPDGRALFLKGRGYAGELAAAAIDWQFSATTRPSITDPDAAVVALDSLRREAPHDA